jgi:hypothetical protein
LRNRSLLSGIPLRPFWKIMTSTGVLTSAHLPVTRSTSMELDTVNLHYILKAAFILVIWFILRIISGYNWISEFLWHKDLKKRYSYSCNRPWRPIVLSDVEAPIFSMQSAHSWRWGCHIDGTRFCQWLSRPRRHSAAERIRTFEKSNDLIWNRSLDLPACSIPHQSTTLPSPSGIFTWNFKIFYHTYTFMCELLLSTLLKGLNAF